jgi:glutathione S-transferase
MEQRLSDADFLAGTNFTIADIALFAYTHVADEGGFDLGPYTAIEAWIETIKVRPKYQPMVKK